MLGLFAIVCWTYVCGLGDLFACFLACGFVLLVACLVNLVLILRCCDSPVVVFCRLL